MEKTEVTMDQPIVLVGVTIIPIVSISLHCWYLDNLATVRGVKKPVAFLVISHTGRIIYGISGEEISVDQVIEKFPGIKEQLARF
jgi:hypothetical protein